MAAAGRGRWRPAARPGLAGWAGRLARPIDLASAAQVSRAASTQPAPSLNQLPSAPRLYLGMVGHNAFFAHVGCVLEAEQRGHDAALAQAHDQS